MAAPLTLEQLFDLLDGLSAEHHLPVIQKFIRDIPDPQQRKFAETILFTARSLAPEAKKKHIVVLIHGIRTHANWQERMAYHLKTFAPEVEVVPIGYDWLPTWRFLWPCGTRTKPVNRVYSQIESIRAANPDAEISVFAHSFGTYVLARILEERADLKLNRIQLCGSVIREDYEWREARQRIAGAIANDAGTRDYWPLFAKNVTWGYGASGTYGFKQHGVTDNFHDLGHSDFFSEEHLKKYWVPFILDGQVVLSEWNAERPMPGFKEQIVEHFPYKMSVAASILAAVWWALA